MLRLSAACLAVAGLSLLLPSEPSYDPWAWLVWGREISHLQLDTTGGPSWKPLTVAFGVLVAPLGDELPPALWVVVARAGALLAMAMAFRLAARLTGGSRALRWPAGTVAAAALALTPDWFQFAAHASEAPLAVGLMLWAVERHLDGRPWQAFVLGVLVCLMRPELFGFLALYAIWLAWAEPGSRPLVAGLMLLLPVAWLVPEWIGSGNPLSAGEQARSEPFWSLSHAAHPWLRALERVHNHVGPALETLGLVAVVVAFSRRQWTVLVLAGGGLAEAALFVAMTQAGFSGNPRYVLPALGVACVLGGVGTARVLEGGAALGARAARRPVTERPALAGAAVAVGLILAGAALSVAGRVDGLRFEVREVGRRMELHRDLERVIAATGAAAANTASSSATVNRGLQTRLAWELRDSISAVEKGHGPGLVFRTRRRSLAGGVAVSGHARSRVELARLGTWTVYRREEVGYPGFTRRLQGFHIRASRGRNAPNRGVTR